MAVQIKLGDDQTIRAARTAVLRRVSRSFGHTFSPAGWRSPKNRNLLINGHQELPGDAQSDHGM